MAHYIRLRRVPPGFTLGEVLLAILFISIAFFAFASLQQRLIYSSWKTELRNGPREKCHSSLVTQQINIRGGGSPNIDQVSGVNPGLYHIKPQIVWTDKSAVRAGGIEQEQSYTFETYATNKRVSGWKQD